MRILLTWTLIYLFTASNAFGWGFVYVQPGEEAGDDYTDITFWLNYENSPSGNYTLHSTNEHSEGDTTGAMSGGTWESSVVDANSGTYSLMLNAEEDHILFAPSGNDIIPQAMQIMITFEVTTWGAGDFIIFAQGGSGALVGMFMTGTDEVVWRYGWSSGNYCQVTTTNANIATGTTVTMTFLVDTVAETMTVEKDGAAVTVGSLTYADGENMLTHNAWSALYIGYHQNNGGDWNTGKFIISDDLERDMYDDFAGLVNYPGN